MRLLKRCACFYCESWDYFFFSPYLAVADHWTVLEHNSFFKLSLLGEAGKQGEVNVQLQTAGTSLAREKESCGQKPNRLK